MTTDILMQRHKAILPILGMCLSYALYSVADASIKIVASGMHVSQLICLFLAIQILPIIFIGRKLDGDRVFKTNYPKLMGARAILCQLSIAAAIMALPHLELTTYYTLFFTSPFWVAIIASYLLKDKMGVNRIMVIMVGFGSVLYALGPSLNGGFLSIWAIMVLFSAFISSLDMVIVRKLKDKESNFFLMLSVAVVGVIVHAPIMIANYTHMSLYMFAAIVCLAMIKMAAFLLKMYCFQAASSAAVVAPLHYTQIVWGSIMGYLLFNEVPSHQTTIAAFIIVMSGIYLIYCEKNMKQETAG